MECIEDKTALTYPWLECCQDDQNSPPDKHDERCSTPSAWSDASPLASSPSTPNLLQPTRERLLTYFIGQDIKLTNLAASQETDGENRTYFLQRIPPTYPISSGKSKTMVEYEYDDYVDALICKLFLKLLHTKLTLFSLDDHYRRSNLVRCRRNFRKRDKKTPRSSDIHL